MYNGLLDWMDEKSTSLACFDAEHQFNLKFNNYESDRSDEDEVQEIYYQENEVCWYQLTYSLVWSSQKTLKSHLCLTKNTNFLIWVMKRLKGSEHSQHSIATSSQKMTLLLKMQR